MTRILATLAATLLASTAAVSSADAAPIVYTLSGTYTGTIDGNAFSTFTTFTGIGDTSSATPGWSGSTVVSLSSLTALVGSTTYTVLGQSMFVNSPRYVATGFANMTYGAIAGARSSAFAGYDGVSDFGPLSVRSMVRPLSFKTDKGSVVISKASGITFSAAISTMSALSVVPEPATWLLMIAGFGVVGGAMRQRTRQVRTAYAYA